MCWSAERDFGSGSRAPSAARQFVRSSLRGQLDPVRAAEVIDDAELVASELVTNAVRAGARTVHLALHLHRAQLELDVTDDGSGWPRLVRPGERDPRGRGLVLVDALADRWRAQRVDAGGKRVGVTIALPEHLTRSLPCDRPWAGVTEHEG